MTGRIDYLKYLGRPFRLGARGPDAYDCFGLVRAVYADLGVILPDYPSPCEPQEIDRYIFDGSRGFRYLWKPEPWAIVTISLVPRWTSHVGIVIDDGRRFLHILQQSSVTVERLDAPEWIKRIKGYYAWQV